MIKRRMQRVILSLLCLLVLPGCWDRTEINDMAFILVSALDLEANNKIRYSVMVPLPGQMGGASGGGGGTAGEKSYYIDSEVGSTYREAQMKMQRRMSRRMFLAHRRTILVGEELAKKGISEFFDPTPRSPESRMSTYLIVTKGYAYKMMQSNPRFERFPSEAIRELVKARYVADMNFKDFGLALSIPGSDPVAVYMDVTDSQKSEKSSKEVELKGYAQFKRDKFVGTYEDMAANGLSWLRNQHVLANITVHVEQQHLMNLKLYGVKSRVDVSLGQDALNFKIHVNVRAKLTENRSYYDLSQTQNLLKVEQATSDYVKKSIQTIIARMTKSQTDSAQLGTMVWRSYPNEWKKQYEKNWPEGLKKAKFTIDVESEITDTGLIYENVLKEH